MFVILARYRNRDHVFSRNDTNLILLPLGESRIAKGAMAFATEKDAREGLKTIVEQNPTLEDEYGPFDIGKMEPLH